LFRVSQFVPRASPCGTPQVLPSIGFVYSLLQQDYISIILVVDSFYVHSYTSQIGFVLCRGRLACACRGHLPMGHPRCCPRLSTMPGNWLCFFDCPSFESFDFAQSLPRPSRRGQVCFSKWHPRGVLLIPPFRLCPFSLFHLPCHQLKTHNQCLFACVLYHIIRYLTNEISGMRPNYRNSAFSLLNSEFFTFFLARYRDGIHN
jgi:hypothetical protein